MNKYVKQVVFTWEWITKNMYVLKIHPYFFAAALDENRHPVLAPTTQKYFVNNNFIDFIFYMKILVPKQWQMKKLKQ